MVCGIKDKVVIFGMGCICFGEWWDKDVDSLMVEVYEEVIFDVGIDGL